ncbi:MAG: FAD-binding oxidoreductase [Melioribacteraceae bacterium]|nr:FAD-binding oxidoreductase [Melioribacteraceae bacterium]MCF8354439.1 FAD-binding oxidoreductase [Melioribacteraceae bacterium]MCF8394049.1 FAD-binding oxidoreductase [Melioribacteraceae bacterium]MCF8419815.1 FAD-binding oxidoreductase [Melioribacteraceae bacterium]
MIIKNNPEEIQTYLVDAANYKGFCEEVVFPESENDIINIVKEANKTGKKITVAGNGTGLTGARVPEGGIVIATDKLNSIINIDCDNQKALVQPAVLLADFQSELKEKELFYPPDPTETNCFIGATIATNASGARTFKYGPTRNFVNKLNVILPTGEILSIERGKNFAEDNKLTLLTGTGSEIIVNVPKYKMPGTKHSAGYYVNPRMDAIDLFIGAEGTLGIITEVELKVLPLPQNVFSSVIFFSNEDDALSFISAVRNKSKDNPESIIDASALEYFDERALKFLIDDFPNIPAEAKAAVWLENEFEKKDEEILYNKWIELIEKFNGDIDNAWFAFDNVERKSFQDFRHAVSWKVSEYLVKNNLKKVGTDTAVPHEKFKEFYYSCKDLVENAGIDYIAYGHFGDSHLHLNMLPKSENEYSAAKELYADICRLSVSLGGTISAEHGIGKLKREYLLEMYGEKYIIEMAKVKKMLDPNSIMNIGNIFSEEYLK